MPTIGNRPLCALLAVVLAACAPRGGQGVDDAFRSEFAAKVQRDYIDPFKAQDVDRWLAVFADDAVGLHDTLPPLEGKDALRMFANAVREHFRIDSMDVTVDEVRRSGQWAYTRGRYQTRMSSRDGTPPPSGGRGSGKYFLLWAEQPDGQWRVILDMGSRGPAVQVEDAVALGRSTYDEVCAVCHETGAGGAPARGDTQAWGIRFRKGEDIVYANAINGYQGALTVMPPKGGRFDLADDAVRAAVDYMAGRNAPAGTAH